MRPNKASDFCMIFKSSFWGCKIRACVRGRSHSSARSDKSLEHRGCQGAQGCRNNQCSCSLVPQRCSATVMEIKNHQSCCTGWRVTGCPVWGHDSNPQSWCLDRFCLQKIKISNSSCCCLDNRRTIKGFCSAFMEEQICDPAQCLKKLWPLPSAWKSCGLCPAKCPSNSGGFQWKFHGREEKSRAVSGCGVGSAAAATQRWISHLIEKKSHLILFDGLLQSITMWKYLTSIWKYIRKVNLIYHLKNRSLYTQLSALLRH